MSNLNNYLVELQRGRFFTREGEEVYYSEFGDIAFNLGLQCIQSYFKNYKGAELDAAQGKCNSSKKTVRIAIEKNYAQVSNGFCICCLKEGSKIAKTNPIAIEQLQVCHLCLQIATFVSTAIRRGVSTHLILSSERVLSATPEEICL